MELKEKTILNIDQDYLLESYDYHLPKDQIAARPKKNRHESKLLVYEVSKDKVSHRSFLDLAEFLPEHSLLVLNQTKVFPCRLLGQKTSGGKCEIFVLSLKPIENNIFRVLIKTTRKKKVGDQFYFGKNLDLKATIEKTLPDNTFGVSFNTDNLKEVLEKEGKVPIPPYIRGGDSDHNDLNDYQTIYARDVGSVAAPTAGFHFSDAVFSSLNEKNIDVANITLHVGIGTFAPVKEQNLLNHKMHEESYFITEENLKKIKKSNKTFAVGTTSLRALESSLDQDGNYNIDANQVYETDIFLYPGKNVRSVDGLFTNFHLPKSTLLMLVSSLIGRKKTLELYQEAVKQKYRFFSYGDAMLILR